MVEFDVGELERGRPPDRVQRQVQRAAQPFGNGRGLAAGGHPVEAADPHVDRVDGAAAHELQQCVAGLLQLQAAFDDVAVIPGEGDRVGVAEEVGGVQQVDVQGVAGDPLPAVQQPAQVSQRRVEFGAARLLDGVARAGLVGDRADPADPGRDIGWLGVGAAAQERFKEPRRFVDVQLGLLDLAVADRDPQRALAFDPGQPGDGELPSAMAHRGSCRRRRVRRR